jgi:hypothetical protein
MSARMYRLSTALIISLFLENEKSVDARSPQSSRGLSRVVSYQVGDKKIDYQLPPGQCPIDRNSGYGAQQIALQKVAQGELNDVLDIIVGCDVASLTMAKAASVPAEKLLSFRVLLRQKGPEMSLVQVADLNSYLVQIDEAASPMLARNVIPDLVKDGLGKIDVKMTQPVIVRLGRDKSAFYLGGKVTQSHMGKSWTHKFVSAITMLKRQPVSLNIFAPASDKSTVVQMYQNAKMEASRFVAINE